MTDYRKPLLQRPADLPPGAPIFLMPKGPASKYDERCITYAWLGNRPLFGEVYSHLLPEYYDRMPMGSGVMIGSFIRSESILPGLSFPGDIDVLVIPCEGDELLLSYTLALEIKIIRASFLRQERSPNQFGFSQAVALLAAGFPYVAVGHLIVSDRSPKEAWREVGMTTILDGDSGAYAPLETTRHDMLPADLMARSHGRLKRNCSNALLGHFSAYPLAKSIWFPFGAQASFNPLASESVMDGIYDFYQQNHQDFLWTSKHPPVSPAARKDWKSEGHIKQLIRKMQRDFR